MKKSYAKVLAGAAVVGLAALSSQAQAAASQIVCAGAATTIAVNGGGGATTASTTGFFQQGFVIQCSNNVNTALDESSATQMQVIGNSNKGNQIFGGTSAGGAIKVLGPCAGTPIVCSASDMTQGNLNKGST